MNIQRRSDSVTIAQVANRAGVSVGTVSRALNGYSNISPENLKRVRKAAAELGYQKCESAGLLASRKNGMRVRTGNIGLVYTEMGPRWANHPLMLAYTLGVEQACRERRCHLLIEMTQDPDTVPRCIRERKVDGLLIKASRHAPAFAQDVAENFPMIGMGFNDPSAAIYQVVPDNSGAGWTVTDHLWRKGHRRIAFVNTNVEHPIFIARFQGYEGYLWHKQAYEPGRVVMEQLPVSANAPEDAPPDMSAILDKLWGLGAGQEPTAIIAANDWMALGLYAALAERGLRVPEDVSVVGFDNSPATYGPVMASLTSFDPSFALVAQASALRLFEQIDNPAQLAIPAVQLVRGKLVERTSVRTLPDAGLWAADTSSGTDKTAPDFQHEPTPISL